MNYEILSLVANVADDHPKSANANDTPIELRLSRH